MQVFILREINNAGEIDSVYGSLEAAMKEVRARHPFAEEVYSDDWELLCVDDEPVYYLEEFAVLN